MLSEPDGHLEQLLEAAGRDAQPHGTGWDELPARLGGTPQLGPRLLRWWAILSGMAAMIAAGIGIALYFTAGRAAVAQDQPIRVVRQDVEITVFNEIETQRLPLYMPTHPLFQLWLDPAAYEVFTQQRMAPQPAPSARPPRQAFAQTIQGPGRRRGWAEPTVKSGMVLVKDRRLVMNLKRGDNLVQFTDVAATIDPTSVRFFSDTDPVGTMVVEQNFEYDLATAAALLKRYLDKQVTCIAKNGDEHIGYLCSHDDRSIVLAEQPPREDRGDRKTQTISRDELRAIQLVDVPQDLFVKPTLVWKIRTDRPGQHDTTLMYVCGEAKWEADYIAMVTPGSIEAGDRLDLQGWVTIDNRTGSTYPDAKIKLIAGDVNRVPDPWAPEPAQSQDQGQSGLRLAQSATQAGEADGKELKEFQEKAFFEYHLYTLSAPSTVKDNQIKQLKLLKANDIKATRWFVFDPQVDDSKVAVRLEFKNDQENQMGMPLPKGRVRLMQRDEAGDLQFIGQDEIDHTPKDEEMKLKLGFAFDVTAERVQTDNQRPTDRREIQTIRLRMRNHKDSPINARFIEHLIPDRNWTITHTTDDWTREDVSTVHFDFTLNANDEKTITYTVDYQW